MFVPSLYEADSEMLLQTWDPIVVGLPHIFVHLKSYYFCELELHANFWDFEIIPDGQTFPLTEVGAHLKKPRFYSDGLFFSLWSNLYSE